MPTYRRLLILWFFVPLHLFLFRLSGGRIFGRLRRGWQSSSLMTRGRKSAKRRATPLLYFEVGEPGEYIVVASNYGQDHDPAWFLNVVARTARCPSKSPENASQPRLASPSAKKASRSIDKVCCREFPLRQPIVPATERVIPVVALRRA